jgi:hypothetical protein
MTDTSMDLAQAHAALASRRAPELRVLHAVHNGLLALPDDLPPLAWDVDGEAPRITIRRATG